MGLFANILPVKTAIDEDQIFLQYLATFKAVLMDSLAHDAATYEDIVAQGKTSTLDCGYCEHLFSPVRRPTRPILCRHELSHGDPRAWCGLEDVQLS